MDNVPPLPEGYSMDQHLSPALRDISGVKEQFAEMDKLPSQQWLAEHYGQYGDTSPTQALERYKNRNFFDKTMDFAQKIGVDPFVKHTEAAIDATKKGQYAKAGNEGFKAATPIGLAFIPQMSAVRPIATAVGIGSGAIGSAATQGLAQAAGATPDQAELAGNIGGLATGAAGYGLTPKSPAASKELASLLAREVTGRLPFLGRVEGLKKPSLTEYIKTLSGAAEKAPETTDIAGPTEAPTPIRQPTESVPTDQLYGKYSGRSRATRNKKQLEAFNKKNAPPDYAPQSFFNPDAPIWLRMARQAAAEKE